MSASYQDLHATGELARRAETALARLAACDLCPRACGVNRLAGREGFCRTGGLARVASYGPHFGEEAPLVGDKGSGTIFFARCNLGCVFCQNRDISRGRADFPEVTARELAAMMRDLQDRGAANINLVTPTHVAAQILEALPLAVDMGLVLPLVWNTSGYESPSTLRLLEGVVDIYMPDTKFWDPEPAGRFCLAADYPDAARAALREMRRQVGDLRFDGQGLARRGLLIRHLVMPGDLGGSEAWSRFLATEVSPRAYVNIMDQYRPRGPAADIPELAGHPSPELVERVRSLVRSLGLRLDDGHEHVVARLISRLSRGD